MKKKFLLIATTLGALTLAAAPLVAHHSFAAQYDRAKQATLTGPVTRMEWINPHARFFMDVKDPTTGKVANWEVELSAPAMLMRRGWTKAAVVIGQPVTVKGSLAKDGSNLINASNVTLSNGKGVFGQTLDAGSSGDAGGDVPATK